MWETLSPAWQACLEEAWAAYCAGSVPIGAVVTDASGQILARGRNHANDSGPAPVHGHTLAHAEVNALLALDNQHAEPHTCILYTSCEPCPLCLGALYMSGLRELRYASRDPFAGSVNLLGTTPYLSRKPIRVFGPERADLETILGGLHTEFVLRDSGESYRHVLDAWAAVAPEGVRLGEQMFRDGRLRWMGEAGMSAVAVVRELSIGVKGWGNGSPDRARRIR
jgi:tRNA(Arg) A34 adenosine deaminase TadA